MAHIIRKRGIVTKSFPWKAEFLAEVWACIERARVMYPEMSKVPNRELPIVFFDTGTTAGYHKVRKVNHKDVHNLEFNTQAILLNWHDMFDDTIPHEVAHLVCYLVHGRKVPCHGPKWKRIAINLGGTAKRTHDYELEKCRKRRKIASTHIYRGAKGVDLVLTQIRHNKLQRGKMKWYGTATAGRVYKDDYIGLKELQC